MTVEENVKALDTAIVCVSGIVEALYIEKMWPELSKRARTDKVEVLEESLATLRSMRNYFERQL